MNNDRLRHNRVILCHFDTYSAALLFARYGASVLAPSPLPDGASAMPAVAAPGPEYDCAAVLDALGSDFGLDAGQLSPVDGFDEWVMSESAPIRVHLARFTTFEAPRAALEPHGGVFKPISEMRGTPVLELNMLRRAFNLMMGGS